MQISSLLDRLAQDLNDAAPGHEFTTWPRALLLSYLEEGLQVAFASRPDFFLDQHTVKLDPCTLSHKLCGCTKIYRVLGQSTKDGHVIRQLRQRKHTDRLLWTGRACTGNRRNFALLSYSIDDVADTLWVYPAVPYGTDVYVLVECAAVPKNVKESDSIPDDLAPAISQWVLYRALMIDMEMDQGGAAIATSHEAEFWKLLQANRVTPAARGGETNNAGTV